MLKEDLYLKGGKIPERLLLLAVYDPLMQGQHNKPLGADARSRVPCTIRGVLYTIQAGAIRLRADDGDLSVAAELLEVTPETLARIDVLEGYTRLYMRETVIATLVEGSVVSAMVYVMKRLSTGGNEARSGEWIS